MKKFLILGFLFASCGSVEDESEVTPTVQTPKECTGPICLSTTVSVNPLNITVDGESYDDSEVWYTQQMNKLEEEAKQNYPDLKLRIAGSIGLSDLANGLTYIVYNQNLTKQQTDSFFYIDGMFKAQSFNILAVKRVNIELLNSYGRTEQSWCFNFKGTGSFIADNRVYANIKDWNTSLTRYKCSSVDSRTFGIP